MGTTFSLAIKGCLALIKVISFFVLIFGVIPLIALEYFAFAKIKSSFPIILVSFDSSSIYGVNNALRLVKICSISISSSYFKLLSSLFNSKIIVGSINMVEPAFEISWINPCICERYSSLTGITNLSFLIVTICSWMYFE